jgi:superfamily II DNA or RNA helicase
MHANMLLKVPKYALKILKYALKNSKTSTSSIKTAKKLNMYKWKPREYQQEIINYCTNELLENNKIYIELPTGGGKSFIVYNLLKILQSEFIIIFSPRKIINSQALNLSKIFTVFGDQNQVFTQSGSSNNCIRNFYGVCSSNPYTSMRNVFSQAYYMCCFKKLNE